MNRELVRELSIGLILASLAMTGFDLCSSILVYAAALFTVAGLSLFIFYILTEPQP